MRPALATAVLLLAACAGGEPDAGSPEERARSIERGAMVYETCASCHAMTAATEEPYFGPHLEGIFGRPIAADANYDYTPALRGLEGAWNRERLAAYLRAPRAFAPGTTMVQALPDSQDVVDVLTWMRAVQDGEVDPTVDP